MMNKKQEIIRKHEEHRMMVLEKVIQSLSDENRAKLLQTFYGDGGYYPKAQLYKFVEALNRDIHKIEKLHPYCFLYDEKCMGVYCSAGHTENCIHLKYITRWQNETEKE